MRKSHVSRFKNFFESFLKTLRKPIDYISDVVYYLINTARHGGVYGFFK